MKKLIRLIEAEIARTQANIDRHKSSGVYVEYCHVWSHHLEAYERILALLAAQRTGKA